MNFAEYKDVVRDCAINFIDNAKDSVKDWDELLRWMELDDSVTGNGSGSYFMNRNDAMECVMDVIFDDDLWGIARMDGYTDDILYALSDCNPEGFDVVVRSLALYTMYDELYEYYMTGNIESGY